MPSSPSSPAWTVAGFFPFPLLLLLVVVVVSVAEDEEEDEEEEEEEEEATAFCCLRTAARRSEVLAFAFRPSDLANT